MDLTFRQGRWTKLLKDYDTTILYVQGKDNVVGHTLIQKVMSLGC